MSLGAACKVVLLAPGGQGFQCTVSTGPLSAWKPAPVFCDYHGMETPRISISARSLRRSGSRLPCGGAGVNRRRVRAPEPGRSSISEIMAYRMAV